MHVMYVCVGVHSAHAEPIGITKETCMLYVYVYAYIYECYSYDHIYVVLLENLPDVASRIQEQPEITLNCAALALHTVSLHKN